MSIKLVHPRQAFVQYFVSVEFTITMNLVIQGVINGHYESYSWLCDYLQLTRVCIELTTDPRKYPCVCENIRKVGNVENALECWSLILHLRKFQLSHSLYIQSRNLIKYNGQNAEKESDNNKRYNFHWFRWVRRTLFFEQRVSESTKTQVGVRVSSSSSFKQNIQCFSICIICFSVCIICILKVISGNLSSLMRWHCCRAFTKSKAAGCTV